MTPAAAGWPELTAICPALPVQRGVSPHAVDDTAAMLRLTPCRPLCAVRCVPPATPPYLPPLPAKAPTAGPAAPATPCPAPSFRQPRSTACSALTSQTRPWRAGWGLDPGLGPDVDLDLGPTRTAPTAAMTWARARQRCSGRTAWRMHGRGTGLDAIVARQLLAGWAREEEGVHAVAGWSHSERRPHWPRSLAPSARSLARWQCRALPSALVACVKPRACPSVSTLGVGTALDTAACAGLCCGVCCLVWVGVHGSRFGGFISHVVVVVLRTSARWTVDGGAGARGGKL